VEEHKAQANVLAGMTGLPFTLTISAEKYGGYQYMKIHSITDLADDPVLPVVSAEAAAN